MNQLQQAYEELVSLIELMELPYAVAGSWASSAFGMPRATYDIDLVVKLDPDEAGELATRLRGAFVVDPEHAREAIRLNRSFNAIHIASGYKFDIFPSTSFPHGESEIVRRRMVDGTALVPEGKVPMVSAEDITLAKLAWFRIGGETSERQWRDLESVWQISGDTFDRAYLEAWATKMQTLDLLRKLTGWT